MNPFLKIIQISSFEMLGVVLYLIISLIIFIKLSMKKVGFNKILVGSLLIGILGAVAIHFMDMSEKTKIDELKTWLNIFPKVFFYLILLLTPVLLGVKVTHLILNNKSNLKFNYIFYINIFVVFIAIGIVLPLLNYVSFPTEDLKSRFGLINWIIASDKKITPYWYLSIIVFASLIIISTIVGLSILYAKKKSTRYTFEKTNDVFSSVKFFLEYIISCISKVLPMVLISVIPLFFYDDANAETNLMSTLKFIGIFVISSLILTSVLKIINKRNAYNKQNISLLISTLFFPLILAIVSLLNKNGQLLNSWKTFGFIWMFFGVSIINYITYYKELTHTDNFLDTAAERSITIVLGSFSLITNIYLYLLIMKPLYIVSEFLLDKFIKPIFNKFIKPKDYEFKKTKSKKGKYISSVQDIKTTLMRTQEKKDISILIFKNASSFIKITNKKVKKIRNN